MSKCIFVAHELFSPFQLNNRLESKSVYLDYIENVNISWRARSWSLQTIFFLFVFQLEVERNYSLCSRNLNIEDAFRKLSAIQSQYSKVINQLPKGQFLLYKKTIGFYYFARIVELFRRVHYIANELAKFNKMRSLSRKGCQRVEVFLVRLTFWYDDKRCGVYFLPPRIPGKKQ